MRHKLTWTLQTNVRRRSSLLGGPGIAPAPGHAHPLLSLQREPASSGITPQRVAQASRESASGLAAGAMVNYQCLILGGSPQNMGLGQLAHLMFQKRPGLRILGVTVPWLFCVQI